MKRIISFIAAVAIAISLFAQSPQMMSYQAVIRNAGNNLVTNMEVGMQISILQGSANGTAVYVETHIATTNANGLVSIEIGGGTVQTGDFDTIDWANGPYFITTETDPTGGTSYTITGTSQLLSVPYALHAKTADSISNIAQKVVMTTGSQIVSGGKTFINGFNTHYIEVNAFNTGNRNAFIDFHGDDTYTDYSLRLARYSSGRSILEHRGTATFSIQATDSASILFSTRGQERMIIYPNGNIDMKNSQVTNVKTPVNAKDAATKAYVDEVIENLYAEGALRLKDVDGNYYNTIKIGTQIWMAENLKATKYADGTAIPLVMGESNWDALVSTSKAYCWYNDDIANKAIYGALYTWAAAMNGASSTTNNPSGIQGVCPTGWHLPSDAEWNQLINYLGGISVAGGKLKEIGTTHWTSPNTGATNKTGFTALPGGIRYFNGTIIHLGNFGFWWSATEESSAGAYNYYMSRENSNVEKTSNLKENGFSVRCVRN